MLSPLEQEVLVDHLAMALLPHLDQTLYLAHLLQ
jgi:hypothetical protein